MKWIARFALWATALAWPCQLLAASYQAWLIKAVALTLGYHVHADPGASPDLAAANVLGIFVAMCLASTCAPRMARFRAVAIGLGIMALVELLTGICSIAALLAQGAHGPWPPLASRVFDGLLALPRFGTAPAVWLFLLGPYELPWGSQDRGVPVSSRGRHAARSAVR